jgi:hypothetical protein
MVTLRKEEFHQGWYIIFLKLFEDDLLLLARKLCRQKEPGIRNIRNRVFSNVIYYYIFDFRQTASHSSGLNY